MPDFFLACQLRFLGGFNLNQSPEYLAIQKGGQQPRGGGNLSTSPTLGQRLEYNVKHEIFACM